MDISEQNICNILPTIEYCGTITRGEGILRVDDEEKKAAMLMIGLLRTRMGWHQIRRHLNGLSHPILDNSYNR